MYPFVSKFRYLEFWLLLNVTLVSYYLEFRKRKSITNRHLIIYQFWCNQVIFKTLKKYYINNYTLEVNLIQVLD